MNVKNFFQPLRDYFSDFLDVPHKVATVIGSIYLLLGALGLGSAFFDKEYRETIQSCVKEQQQCAPERIKELHKDAINRGMGAGLFMAGGVMFSFASKAMRRETTLQIEHMLATNDLEKRLGEAEEKSAALERDLTEVKQDLTEAKEQLAPYLERESAAHKERVEAGIRDAMIAKEEMRVIPPPLRKRT